jgi:TRAP-type uncharacterized transport system fused permease subunit
MGTSATSAAARPRCRSLSSGLMGTINGLGRGQRGHHRAVHHSADEALRLQPAFAGGVEATASMGGQIMPPVMGAVAFIMAETINVPYARSSRRRSFRPCCISARLLDGAPGGRAGRACAACRRECPNAWAAVRERWYLLMPLAVLVWLLFSGLHAAVRRHGGLALTVVLILGSAVILRVSSFVLLRGPSGSPGLPARASSSSASGTFFVVIAVLVAQSCGSSRAGARRCASAGTRWPTARATRCRWALPARWSGVIIGVMTLTGVAATFGGFIIAVGAKACSWRWC